MNDEPVFCDICNSICELCLPCFAKEEARKYQHQRAAAIIEFFAGGTPQTQPRDSFRVLLPSMQAERKQETFF